MHAHRVLLHAPEATFPASNGAVSALLQAVSGEGIGRKCAYLNPFPGKPLALPTFPLCQKIFFANLLDDSLSLC